MSTLVIPADRAANHGGPDFFKGGEKFAKTFEMWGGLKPSDSVLDIGCGPGRMAIGIGERFGWSNRLTGFDIIALDVDVCQSIITVAHPNFQFAHVNAWNGHYNPEGTIQPNEVKFPTEDGTIDFAFATSVFTHMYRREVLHYLQESYRVLKPGGRLLSSWFSISDTTSASPNARWKFLHRLPDGSFTDRPERPEDVIGYRHEEILALMREAGFEQVEFYQGDWSKTVDRSKIRHGQDVFVAHKN